MKINDFLIPPYGISRSMELHDRLRQLRIDRGYPSAAAAARAMGEKVPTYSAHENGTTPPPRAKLSKYAAFFRATVDYLLTGKGKPAEITQVPLVGYVGAGAQAQIFSDSQGPFDYVDAPLGSSDRTVAVEIRGESLGSFFDRWLIFYDDRREPLTSSMIGKLCVLGLADGRVLVKRLKRGQIEGRWTLESQFEPPIYDVQIEWGAVVKNMTPR